VQKVLNNASADVASGGKRNVAITPIAVINSAKAGEVKQKSAIAKSAMPNGSNAVKLTAIRADTDAAFTVYEGGSAGRNVLVYR
jgi:hypothetical protein